MPTAPSSTSELRTSIEDLRSLLAFRSAGLDRAARVLAPGGVLTVWSAAPAPDLQARLADRFAVVESLEVPVERGAPDVVVVARDPRPAGPANPRT